MAHQGDLMTEAVNVEMIHQADHALQVQVEVIHPPVHVFVTLAESNEIGN